MFSSQSGSEKGVFVHANRAEVNPVDHFAIPEGLAHDEENPLSRIVKLLNVNSGFYPALINYIQNNN